MKISRKGAKAQRSEPTVLGRLTAAYDYLSLARAEIQFANATPGPHRANLRGTPFRIGLEMDKLREMLVKEDLP